MNGMYHAEIVVAESILSGEHVISCHCCAERRQIEYTIRHTEVTNDNRC